jgi:Zn-dependent protease
LAALLFFSSVLAHELAHSLVARAQGMPVENITLFLFGGVSSIQQEPESPGKEFLMAVLGPVTSLVLGAILIIVGGLTITDVGTAVGAPTDVLAELGAGQTLLLWLGSINIALGIFNLIPGFPLDGGRVLRSIFWASTDNFIKATRWASIAGHIVAWTMILSGVAMIFGVEIPFLGTGFVNGLWLAFIGWFLNNAASRSYQRVVVQDVLEGVTVAEMMRPNPPTVSQNLSVRELVHDYVMQEDDYAFPVMKGNDLIGLVTLQDIRDVSRDRWDDTTVGEIMTPAEELITVTTDGDASDALLRLTQREFRQLPVMENGSFAGLVRRRDIIKWLQLHSEAV